MNIQLGTKNKYSIIMWQGSNHRESRLNLYKWP